MAIPPKKQAGLALNWRGNLILSCDFAADKKRIFCGVQPSPSRGGLFASSCGTSPRNPTPRSKQNHRLKVFWTDGSAQQSTPTHERASRSPSFFIEAGWGGGDVFRIGRHLFGRGKGRTRQSARPMWVRQASCHSVCVLLSPRSDDYWNPTSPLIQPNTSPTCALRFLSVAHFLICRFWARVSFGMIDFGMRPHSISILTYRRSPDGKKFCDDGGERHIRTLFSLSPDLSAPSITRITE